MSETQEESTYSTPLKMGVSVWLSFCVIACIWFLSRFFTGRSQLRSNLHVIEDGLKRMQDEIDKKQQETGVTDGEDYEELGKELFNSLGKKNKTEEEKEKEKKLIEEMEKIIAEEEALELKRNEEMTESGEDEEEEDDDDEDPFQDKKND